MFVEFIISQRQHDLNKFQDEIILKICTITPKLSSQPIFFQKYCENFSQNVRFSVKKKHLWFIFDAETA